MDTNEIYVEEIKGLISEHLDSDRTQYVQVAIGFRLDEAGNAIAVEVLDPEFHKNELIWRSLTPELADALRAEVDRYLENVKPMNLDNAEEVPAFLKRQAY